MWVWFTLFKVHFDSTHVLATLCFQKQLSCFASPHRSAIWRTILSAMHMSWHGGLQDTMFGDFEFIYDLIRRFSMKAPLNNCPGPENSFSARLTFPLFSHPSISFASLQVVVIRASFKKKMFRLSSSKPERHPWVPQFVTGSSDAVLWLRFCHLPAGPNQTTRET